MIARVLTPGKNITIEVEATGMIALFDQLAEVSGVFGALQCGHCDGVSIKLQTRPGKSKDGKSFLNREAVCLSCFRIMRMGVASDLSTIWAKNKPSDGGAKGWFTWAELTGSGGGQGDTRHTDDVDQRRPDVDEAERPY